MTYEEIDFDGIITIKKTDAKGTETWIPVDEGNSDYQRYLRWLENPDADESGTL